MPPTRCWSGPFLMAGCPSLDGGTLYMRANFAMLCMSGMPLVGHCWLIRADSLLPVQDCLKG